MANKYTLGRGELWFARFAPGTQNPLGERYIGNTPEFSATIESENLDHFNSDRGINEKDESIVLQTNRSANFVTDNIDVENISLFFFGSTQAVTDAGATVTDEPHTVSKGFSYQLGITALNPVGARKLDPNTPVAIEPTGGGAAYTIGTDFEVDSDLGRITIPETSTIPNDSEVLVTYTRLAHSLTRVLSGAAAVEGAFRYIEFNPIGENKVWYMPYVKLSPNGDYALKGDEWQQIPFSVEILRKTGLEAIYIDGVPIVS